jgi:hypothetical protein
METGVAYWIENEGWFFGSLTTDRSESSYGIPVLVGEDGEIVSPLNCAMPYQDIGADEHERICNLIRSAGYPLAPAAIR